MGAMGGSGNAQQNKTSYLTSTMNMVSSVTTTVKDSATAVGSAMGL